MLDINSHIWELLLTGAMAVAGWFLSTLHKDVKDNTEDIGKLKGKTDVIKTSTDLRIEQLAQSIHELKESIVHMNNNHQQSTIAISEQLTELTSYMKNGRG